MALEVIPDASCDIQFTEDKITETDVWKGDKKLNVLLVILIPDISLGGQ